MALGLTAVYTSNNAFAAAGASDAVSVTVVNNDYLAILGCSGDSHQIMAAPTGGGLTPTFKNSSGVNLTNLNSVDLYWVKATSSQTFTMTRTISPNNSAFWGFAVYRFTGVNAIGATTSDSNATASLPSSNITTGAANAGIVMVITNFFDVLTAPVFTTADAGAFAELSHFFNTGLGTLYAGWYPDAQAAATKNIGMSVPTGQQWSLVSMELQRTASLAAPDSFTVNKALRRSTLY